MEFKKILPHVAMGIYEEEMFPIWEAQRIASEEDACYEQAAREEAQRIALETELGWWEYYEEQCMMEEEEEEQENFYEDTCDTHTISHKQPLNLQRTRGYHRKQEVRCKQKLRRVAMDAMNNIGKRGQEDMKNMTRCKQRGGQLVHMPKSLTRKTTTIWDRAAKMKLVEAYSA